jgi:dihydrofolate synthase/folylpolyglutamate synthase
MNTYTEALAYLDGLASFEKSQFAAFDSSLLIERPKSLLARLGDPHRRFDAVLVAGTKGKGSVVAMIASAFQAAGYRTGRYTSPHLHTVRERIVVNGQMISEESFVALVRYLKPHIEAIKGLTYFEAITALAFLYFAQQGVDLAALEVGLGGRLDATNVVRPQVAVITSLSLDHTALLGDTVAQIAREKAGIIKEGMPVVSAPQPPEALAVIEEVCREKGARLTVVGRDWTWEAGEASLEGQGFKVQTSNFKVQRLWIPLLGRHELINATVAVAAIHLLGEQGIVVPPTAVAEGLRRVRWPGRMEILNKSPLLVVDGAHNGDSARRLAEALREVFTYRRLILVFGASADKDIVGMLRELLPWAKTLILTQARHPRAANPQWLREQALECGADPPGEIVVVVPVAAALDRALALAREDDLICFSGSLFVVAEARESWAERGGAGMPERDPPAGRWPTIMQATPGV